MTKYKAGDLVTIKLDDQGAYCMNDTNYPHKMTFIGLKRRIVSHTPAPFDWKDVKPGMAFTNATYPNLLFFYVGPNFGILNDDFPDCFYRKRINGGGPNEHTIIERSQLTRAPEHDIEVKP